MNAPDPVTLATVTSALTLLGSKVAEKVATEAAQSLWVRIKSVFGWKAEPTSAELARVTAEHIQAHPEQLTQIVQLLQQDTGSVGTLVGHIDAEKVVVAQNIDTVNM